MPKVSIIIPVYNVEKYLSECLESILAQTMNDFEVIMVDDESSDSSSTIMTDYKLRFSEKKIAFNIIRLKHSNAGHCRNIGLKEATGEYVIFLDSDDIFSPWLLETLWNGAGSHADVVSCSYTMFFDGSPIPSFSLPNNIPWKEITFSSLDVNPFAKLLTMPWNKMIRRLFILENNIAFLEQTSTNDFTCMAICIAMSKQSLKTDVPLIAYRQRINSIQATKSKNPCNFFNAVIAYCNYIQNKKQYITFPPYLYPLFAQYYMRSTLWELSTQVSRTAYLSFYKIIVSIEHRYSFMDVCSSSDTSSLVPRRYQSIVSGGIKEFFRRHIEALFSPLLGNKRRLTGKKLRITNILQRLLIKATS